MTTQLPERLRELADGAPGPLSARGLWEQGRRRHRRRTMSAVAVVAAVVVVTVGVGYGSWHSRQPDPVAPPPTQSGPMAVPERFFHPSPWLPGDTRPGRLVALLGTTRAHFPLGEDENAVVGVAAGSQTYRFLDLPGQSADVTDVALSPDGRHVAYWISGSPSGSARLGDRSTVGVANLDLTTGVVQRRVIPTAHGLAPTSLTWTADGNLAVAAGRYTSAEPTSFSVRTRVYFIMWHPTSDPTVGPPSGGAQSGLMTVLPHMNVLPTPVTSTRGYAGMVDHRVLRIWDANRTATQTVRLSHPLRSGAYDAATRRVAGTLGNPDRSGSTSGPLLVGRDVKGSTHLTQVPGGRHYLSVLAWADADHVVTEQLLSTGEAYWVVDVHTGARTALTTTGYQATGSFWYGVALAPGAMRDPTTVPAIAPPRPWNPRWVAGSLCAVLLLVLGAGAILWRRRGRA